MKKILILALTTIVINSYSQSRIKDIPTTQAVYDSGLVVVVDKSTLDSARQMRLATIAPKISYLTEETSSLDPDLEFARISNGTTERKTKVSLLVPNINQYPIGTSLFEITWIPIYDGYSNNRNEKITPNNFMTALAGLTEFGVAVDGRFGNSTFNTYVDNRFSSSTFNTKADARITLNVDSSFLAALLYNTINEDQELQVSGSPVGYLSIQKIGKMVVGQVKVTATTAGLQTISNYTLPSYLRPSIVHSGAVIGFQFDNEEGSSDNNLRINSSGAISVSFSDVGTTGNGIAINYLTD